MASERVLVFDADAWGGRDVGDNSQFWREAEIVERYRRDHDLLAVVCWCHNGQMSRGHFVDCMRPVEVPDA